MVSEKGYYLYIVRLAQFFYSLVEYSLLIIIIMHLKTMTRFKLSMTEITFIYFLIECDGYFLTQQRHNYSLFLI